MSRTKFKEELGTYEGRTHHLRTIWKYNGELRFFAVNISYFDRNELERNQIVRIDNKHGFLHLDQLWKEGKAKDNKIELTWAGSTWKKYFKAEKKLKKEWKKYARRWSKYRGH